MCSITVWWMVPRRDAHARDRLAALAPRVSSGALAGERSLPVAPALRELLPSGITRSSVVGCRGGAALSSAFLLASAASQAGMWTGVAGVAHLGVEACREAGVALERLVVVQEPARVDGRGGDDRDDANRDDAGDVRRTDEQWGHVLASLIDGFDVVVFGAADRVRPGTARRVQSRLQSRGAVMLIVGRPGAFSCDVQVTTEATWKGLGAGHGHLCARRVELAVDGRRIPRTRRGSIWFPDASGEIVAVAAERAPLTVLPPEGLPSEASTAATVALRRTG
jgi:hypothetical protein